MAAVNGSETGMATRPGAGIAVTFRGRDKSPEEGTSMLMHHSTPETFPGSAFFEENKKNQVGESARRRSRRGGLGICRLRPLITLLPLDAFQVHAIQDHGQVGGPNLQAVAVSGNRRKTVASLLETFVPIGQSVPVPIEQHEAVAALVAENKQMP